MTNPRLNKLISLLDAAGQDAIALNPGPTLAYLSGLHLHLMERPMVLLVTAAGKAALVLPELEKLKLQDATLELTPFTYNDNPATWMRAFDEAARFLQMDGLTIGVEPTRLRVLELHYLEDAIQHACFISAENVLAGLRMAKDDNELACMRKAVQIAQDALLATLPKIRPGVSEQEIAMELYMQLLRFGTDIELAFQPIVSGGPNSANPHAMPSERKLQHGDMLVIDWGAAYHGYISDLTRTFAIGAVEPEFEKIHRIVQESNAAGRAAGRPGLPAGAVDKAARDVIAAAGYGQYFTHRVGHGLGMEGHEQPYMFAENATLLEAGYTYTVEPGIYLPGRGGVRIEDDVVVTADGAVSLSDMPRQLQIL